MEKRFFSCAFSLFHFSYPAFFKIPCFCVCFTVGHHLHKGQSHHLNAQRQQPPTERRQGQPPAATKNANKGCDRHQKDPVTFSHLRGGAVFPVPWEGGGTVATFGCCAALPPHPFGPSSRSSPPVPSLSGSGSAPFLGKGNPNPKKEGFPTQGRRPRPRRKVNPNAPPFFGWSSLLPPPPCAVVLLSLLLLPTGLPSPSFLELGCPPRPLRGEQKKKDKSSTHKKGVGDEHHRKRDGREREGGEGREGWPSFGLPLASFFGLGVARVSPSVCGLGFAFLLHVEGCPCFCQTDPRSESDPFSKKETLSQTSSSCGWCCVFHLLSSRAPVPLLIFLPSCNRGLTVLHMSESTVHQQRLNILTTPVTLHVSRVSALTEFVAHVEWLSSWRGHCQGMGLG